MPYIDQAKTLFQLTTELTESKMEVAVNKAINQVVDQIVALRHELHREVANLRQEINDLRHEMIERFSKVESRLSALETALGRRDQVRADIRTRFYDYLFRAGWISLGSALMYLMVYFHELI